jgi:hypothetical protein
MLGDRAGFPARGEEAHHGHQNKEEQENRKSNPVDLIGHDDALPGIELTEFTELRRACGCGKPARSALN